jgi:hypothetical protein
MNTPVTSLVHNTDGDSLVRYKIRVDRGNVQSCREAELRIESAGGYIEHVNDRQQLHRNI